MDPKRCNSVTLLPRNLVSDKTDTVRIFTSDLVNYLPSGEQIGTLMSILLLHIYLEWSRLDIRALLSNAYQSIVKDVSDSRANGKCPPAHIARLLSVYPLRAK